MAASPPSSPSETAFTYEDMHTDLDDSYIEVEPLPQVSSSGPRTSGSTPLDPASLSRPLKTSDRAGDEERRIGLPQRVDEGSREMAPFTTSELVVMSCSSLIVGGLISVAVLLTTGKIVP